MHFKDLRTKSKLTIPPKHHRALFHIVVFIIFSFVTKQLDSSRWMSPLAAGFSINSAVNGRNAPTGTTDDDLSIY